MADPRAAAAPQDEDHGHHRPGVVVAAVMEELIRAGMDVARLDFSHGSFDDHRRNIGNLRAAARVVGRDVATLAVLLRSPSADGARTNHVMELVDLRIPTASDGSRP